MPLGAAGGRPRDAVPFGPSQVSPCNVAPRPYPGRGSRLSLRESPDAKSPRASPWTRVLLKPLAGARSIFWVGRRSGTIAGLFRDPCTDPDLETFFWENIFGWIFPGPFPPFTNLRLPARPAGGRAPSRGGYRAAGQETKKAGYPEGYPRPEWGVQRGETLPSGVLSSISHRRNGGRRQASPPGRCAPRPLQWHGPAGSVPPGVCLPQYAATSAKNCSQASGWSTKYRGHSFPVTS